MIAMWLYRASGNLPCRLISLDGSPYLERYYVFGLFGFHVYLHRFVSADVNEELHDHPWNAVSIVLTGEYCEMRGNLDGDIGVRKRMRRIRWFNWIPANSMHRIRSTERETWTLFIHGPRRKGWGFFVEQFPGGTVTYRPYDTRAMANWWERSQRGSAVGRQPIHLEIRA